MADITYGQNITLYHSYKAEDMVEIELFWYLEKLVHNLTIN